MTRRPSAATVIGVNPLAIKESTRHDFTHAYWGPAHRAA
jgi:hypothetical protein